jgi:hypothetical protein
MVLRKIEVYTELKHLNITQAIKYLNLVISAKAGIQLPALDVNQVRHDDFSYLVARLIT